MWNSYVATIMRKTSDDQRGACHIVVRSSALGEDRAIRVLPEEYATFSPGMLVTVLRVGWGPLSVWSLQRESQTASLHW